MDQKAVFKAVKFFKKCLKERKINISKLILFGSHGSGQANSESDLDLIVVSRDFEGKNIFERAALTNGAETSTIRKFMIPLDVIDLTPQEFESEDSLAASFAKQGISI